LSRRLKERIQIWREPREELHEEWPLNDVRTADWRVKAGDEYLEMLKNEVEDRGYA